MKKAIKRTEKIMADGIISKLTEVKEEIVAILMSAYDTELVVTDRRSKTNPQDPKYRDEFEKRLLEFEYIKNENGKIRFTLPSMETFNFSGNTMRVIQQILEGTAGILKEVSAEDYEKMFKDAVISKEPLDTGVSKKELIYLMRDNNRLRIAERNTFGKVNYLTPYPFSNTPPIPVLDAADGFVRTNMDRWMNEAVDDSAKKVKRGI